MIEFTEFREYKNHSCVNWVRFNDTVCYQCLAGTVLTSPSLTHQVKGSGIFFLQNILSLNSLLLVKDLRENSNITVDSPTVKV